MNITEEQAEIILQALIEEFKIAGESDKGRVELGEMILKSFPNLNYQEQLEIWKNNAYL